MAESAHIVNLRASPLFAVRKPVALALAVLIAVFAGGALGQTTGARYDEIITQARNGRTDAAIVYLEELLAREPANLRARYDLIVIMGWVGRPDEAWRLAERFDPQTAPVYVVSSLAASARSRGRPADAEKLYRTVLLREPRNADACIGLALALSEMGQADAALGLLRQRLSAATAAEQAGLRRAQATIHAAREDFASAADALRELVALEPANPQARRDLAAAYSRAGAAGFAFDTLKDVPPAERGDGWTQSAADTGAALIRWGELQIKHESGPARFAEIDRAIADNAWLLAELAGAPRKDADAIRRARYDRLLALRVRVRMPETVALFEALSAENMELPPYVITAAADAYLYLEQPQRARDLYLQAQVKSAAADPGMGLFYAYIETEQFAEAYALVDRKVLQTPKYDISYTPPRPNETYLSLRVAQAMVRSYGDEQGAAGQMLDELHRLTPFDSDLRAARAAWMNARGWHLRAETELRTLLKEDPAFASARIELAKTRLALRRYRDAELEAAALTALYPENKSVRGLQRDWNIHRLRELDVNTMAGRGSGGTLGNQDFALEARFYSAPLDYNYRVFARSFESYADFGDTHAYRRRIGAGLEYRDPRFTLTGQLAHGRDDGSDASAAASIEWRADDAWSARLSADSSADDIPLRARPAGIRARAVAGELTYRFNESARLSGSLGQQNFSDDNRRRQAGAAYFRRLIARPHYKLDATLGLYASRNSDLPAAPYFNPASDRAADLTLLNEWIVWRRYANAFRHRLALSAGRYGQSGFDAGRTYGLRYEHQWDWQEQFTLRYGIGRSAHPYNGVSELREYAYINLNWRF